LIDSGKPGGYKKNRDQSHSFEQRERGKTFQNAPKRRSNFYENKKVGRGEETGRKRKEIRRSLKAQTSIIAKIKSQQSERKK
jgi:hypothetical protein